MVTLGVDASRSSNGGKLHLHKSNYSGKIVIYALVCVEQNWNEVSVILFNCLEPNNFPEAKRGWPIT